MAFEGSEKDTCSVAICIASCRRPTGLLALLRSLGALTFEDETPEIHVVVIDNDPRESARDVCEHAQDWLPFPIRYGVEPRPGIPQARNASLALAGDEVEWIAFVDDDESVDPRWLENLLRTQRRSGADVVTGPVISRFVDPPAAWVVEGGFFANARFADGSDRSTAYTNNSLVRAAALRELGAGFDERLTVGEDVELSLRLARRGCRTVWADEALVYETVAPERTQLGAILRRGFREGVARARIERWHRIWRPGTIALRALGRIALGIGGALVPLPHGRATRVRSLRHAAFGVGRCLGLVDALRQDFGRSEP